MSSSSSCACGKKKSSIFFLVLFSFVLSLRKTRVAINPLRLLLSIVSVLLALNPESCPLYRRPFQSAGMLRVQQLPCFVGAYTSDCCVRDERALAPSCAFSFFCYGIHASIPLENIWSNRKSKLPACLLYKHHETHPQQQQRRSYSFLCRPSSPPLIFVTCC